MKSRIHSIAVLVIIAALAVSGAAAQSWNSSSTTGLTSVTWSLTGNIYTWTLTNNSGSASNGQPTFDILVWSLQPFQVPLPASWSAPEGWEWGGVGHQAFRLINASEKYMTTPAVTPGNSVTFTYTINPDAGMANSSGPQPDAMAFISHVGVVQPAQSTTGSISWIQAFHEQFGSGWFDAAATSQQTSPHAPEPSGILICLIGGAWLATHLHKNGKRLADSRNHLA